MPQNLATFEAARLFMLSAGTAASAASLSVQLNQSHSFFYLQLPLWILFIAMVVLTFTGAFISLMTDYMRSRGTLRGKLLTAISVGLFISFVVLPAFAKEPNPTLMLITAFVGGLSATILTYITLRVLNNKELHDAITDLIVKRVIEAIDLVTGYAISILKSIFGGKND